VAEPPAPPDQCHGQAGQRAPGESPNLSQRDEGPKQSEVDDNPGHQQQVRKEVPMQPQKQSDLEERAEGQRRTSASSRTNLVDKSARVVRQGQPAVSGPPILAKRVSGLADGRPFRRVFSENDALEAADTTSIAKSPVLETRSPLKLLENLSSRRATKKSKSPTKVQRSASEAYALLNADTSIERSAGETAKEPIGPWTVDEAFLLFDWWPDDVDKPCYWTETTKQPPPRFVAEVVQPLRSGITTARQFLRDDINAL